MQRIAFSVAPFPPFRLDLTASALLRRSVNAIDTWDGEVYSRVLTLDRVAVFLQITQSGGIRSPRVHIKAAADRLPSNGKPQIIEALYKLLGLQVNMRAFYRLAKTDSRLWALTQRFLGLKPPRFPSVFESIVNGIACQQLSLHVGLTLLNRLAAKAGHPFETASGTRFAFPSVEGSTKLTLRAIRSLGFSTNKGLALRHLSEEAFLGTFDPESLTNLDNERAAARLLNLRGVGRWTAEYVLLRGLGRTNVFPGDDVGARNNLRRWLGLEGSLNYDGVKQILAKWYPYSGMLYFHLLLDSLASGPH
jgi:DNA-3-methyladenine glycosylase II